MPGTRRALGQSSPCVRSFEDAAGTELTGNLKILSLVCDEFFSDSGAEQPYARVLSKSGYVVSPAVGDRTRSLCTACNGTANALSRRR